MTEETTVKRFLIEREIPGAADLTPAQLADIAKSSNEVVAGLGVPHTWVNSYVAGDKIYCVWRVGGGAKPGTFNPGTFECKGLSGKYKGLDAKNNFKASTQINWSDGTASGVAIWNR